jgi:MFS superfamily sulfate permease-like transporter
VTTTVLLFIFGVIAIAFSPLIGGRISRYNYGDNLGARRLTIIVTLLAGIVLIAFGIQRLIS